MRSRLRKELIINAISENVTAGRNFYILGGDCVHVRRNNVQVSLQLCSSTRICTIVCRCIEIELKLRGVILYVY